MDREWRRQIGRIEVRAMMPSAEYAIISYECEGDLLRLDLDEVRGLHQALGELLLPGTGGQSAQGGHVSDIPEDVMKRIEALERRVAQLEAEAKERLWSLTPSVLDMPVAAISDTLVENTAGRPRPNVRHSDDRSVVTCPPVTHRHG